MEGKRNRAGSPGKAIQPSTINHQPPNSTGKDSSVTLQGATVNLSPRRFMASCSILTFAG